MSRRRKSVAAIVGTTVFGLALLIALFDWSWFKGPLESLASSQLGRKVEITGDIDGEISLSPRFSFEGVRVANAPWGSRPTMLTAEQMAFEVDLPALLDGRVALPEIALRSPDILVERGTDGALNWQTGSGGESGGGGESEGTGALPEIGRLWVQDARIAYRGPPGGIEARLATLRGSGGRQGATLHGVGSLAGLPLRLDIEAGALSELQAEGEPYPLEIDLEVGRTSAAVRGTIEQPLSLAAADLDFGLESPDPSALLAAAGLAPEPVPPLSISGRMLHTHEAWEVQDLQARLGEGTLSGQAGIDFREEPPLLTADLGAQRLDVIALQSLYERIAPPPTSDEGNEARPIWSAERGLELDLLPDLRMDVAFDARDVVARDLHLRELHLDAMLQEDTPRLQLDARGEYRNEALVVELGAGPQASGPGPYRLESRLEVGANRAELSGSMDEPLSLAGLDLTFGIESPRPRTLLELAGLPGAQIPNLALAGRLTHEDARWQLDGLTARLGESDIAGDLSLDRVGGVPRLSAELNSRSVRIADLRSLITPRTEAVAEQAVEELPVPSPAAGPDRPLITLDGVDRSALPDWQVEVRYALERLSGPQIEVEDAELRARLEDRILAADLSAQGQIQGQPLDAALRIGTLDGGTSDEAGYPIEARLEAGQTIVDVNGRLAEPMRFRRGRIGFEIASPDPARWLELAGSRAPEIAQVRVAGELVREGDLWRLPDLYLEASGSNLFGTASLDLGRERPLLVADLQSDRMLVQELLPSPEDGSESDAEGPEVISARGINLEGLPEIDADLSLQADYIRVEEDMVLERLAADLGLRDRVAVLDMSSEGSFRERPLTIEARLGAPENLRDQGSRYPVEARLVAEMTTAAIAGSIGDPTTFTDLNIDVLFEGSDLTRLGDLLQLPLPSTPPYRLRANLTHAGARWNLGSLEGRIADSDIQGEASIDLSRDRPAVVADLRSDRLDFDDFGTVVGVPPAVGEGETASPQQERQAALAAAEAGLLPDKEFNLPDMRAVDAQVTYAAESVQARQLPIERVTLELRLEDGLLRIEPLRFTTARGAVAAKVRLDARQDPIGTQLDLRVRDLDMNDLLSRFGAELPELEVEQGGRGAMSGKAELEARGNSVKQMAGTLGGDLVLVADGGRINALLVEAAGLDLGEILLLLATDGDEAEAMVPIHCLVMNAAVAEGVVRLEPLLVDTSDSTILGTGTIDLGAERLDLRLAALPKDVSLLSANVPIRVAGSLSDVEIAILAEEILEQGFIDLGLAEDARCQAMLEDARRELEEMTDAPARAG